MIAEFRDFISRGNVLQLAVAFVMGVAFAAITGSLVEDIIMPLMGLVLGGVDFTRLTVGVGDAQVAYGNFLQAVIHFLIIAWALFLIIRSFNAAIRRFRPPREEAATEPPPPTREETLLAEIRDLLASRTRHP